MQIKDCFYLGRLLKPHAMKGEVNFLLDTDSPENYINLPMLFLETRTGLVPYFIEKINVRGVKGYVKFQDVNTIEAAESLRGMAIYLPLDLLPKLTGNKFYYHEGKGFELEDTNHGKVGTIKEVLEYPQQALFQVMDGEKEVLIPISDEVIKEVDRENKLIKVEAPEGLIEMYLE